MGVVLNTNMSALAAYNNLRRTQSRVDSSLEKLSSGLRINRAADDAAGLAISEKLRSQVNGLNQAQRNAQDGISLAQTAEGGLNETHALLQRMRTLAVQAANGTNSPENLQQIQAEMTQLRAEIDHVADGMQFNGMTLLDGSFHDKHLQIGANTGQSMAVDIYSRRIPPTPEVPAVDPTKSATALWDVDKGMPKPGSTVSLSQTVKGTTTKIDVPIPDPGPKDVKEFAALLQEKATPSFTVVTSSYTDKDGDHPDANLIITSETPGAGDITVSGVTPSWTQMAPGSDGSPAIPAKEEQFLGYHAADILDGVIDVTKEAGSLTTPGRTYTTPGGTVTIGGQTIGFGTGSYTKPTEVTVEPTTVVLPPTTTTWDSGASDAIGMIDRAIEIVSRGRGELGAYQNRLEHTSNNLGISAENLAASESRIRDADMAKEMAELSKTQILAQAGTSMLAQANQTPQSILKLLPNG